MKKITLILTAALLVSSSVFATGPMKMITLRGGQGRGGSDGALSVGGRIGASIYTTTYSGPGSLIAFGYKTGITAAGVLNYAFSDLFSIQPELSFVQKGSTFNTGSGEAGITLNYLEVPILAKLSFGGESFKGFIDLGPTLGYALSGTNNDGSGNSTSLKFDDSDGLKRFELGAAFGGGVGIAAGPGWVTIEGRYGLGLSSVGEDKSVSPSITSKNLGYAFSLGYLFPL